MWDAIKLSDRVIFSWPSTAVDQSQDTIPWLSGFFSSFFLFLFLVSYNSYESRQFDVPIWPCLVSHMNVACAIFILTQGVWQAVKLGIIKDAPLLCSGLLKLVADFGLISEDYSKHKSIHGIFFMASLVTVFLHIIGDISRMSLCPSKFPLKNDTQDYQQTA